MKNKNIDNQKIDTKEKNSYFKLMKTGLNELGRRKWKYVFVVLATIFAFFLWNILYALWVIFPFNKLPKLLCEIVTIIYFSAVVILLFFIFSLVIIYIGKTSHYFLKKRCITGFRRCGLKTKTDEVPPLSFVYNDSEKIYGRIYSFENLQIPLDKFQEKTTSIQLILKGKIYDIDYEENTDYTRINVIPNKYIQPYLIGTHRDEFKDFVNLLIVGKTGSR